MYRDMGLILTMVAGGNGHNDNISMGATSSCMTELPIKKQEQRHIVWLISGEQKPMSSKVPILVFSPHIYSQTADAQYL